MRLKKESFKKLISGFLALVILLGNGGFFFIEKAAVVQAQILPTPPPAITPPPTMTPPPMQTPPPLPSVNPNPTPTPPPAITPPPTMTPPPTATSTPRPSPSWTPSPSTFALPITASTSLSPSGNTNENEENNNEVSTAFTPFNTDSSGGERANGETGPAGATIDTGNANSNGAIAVLGNSNSSATPQGDSGGATVVNNGNGSQSNNSGSATVVDNNTTSQGNSATIVNTLNQAALSGNNSASGNTGGDSRITTGDANTTGTILTAVNTNIAGVMVSEFNVVEDHTGDLILDFGQNCILGCGTGDTLVQNDSNASGSSNNANSTQVSNNSTTQSNVLDLTNNMNLIADSGDNKVNDNTNGDSFIETGDANVAANLVTFANNNMAGGVVYGVVNIFGNLIGDLILPESYFDTCCGQNDTTVVNSDNASNSTNNASSTTTTNDTTVQFNTLELENNILLDANTGQNRVNDNTGGTNSISTGDSSSTVQLLNFANNNLAGGNWWLVLVNEAGNWLGHILGADGQNFGGSDPFQFNVNENGEVTVANTGNGSGSINEGSVNSTTNNTTTQTNDAKIVNNLNLTANTGNNSASDNTKGNSSIITGEADIVANIVNFVNNNITGGGKLVVTVVNVFGSWMGDFVGPGFTKEDTNTETNNGGTGGFDAGTQQSSSNSNNTNSTQNSNVASNNPVIQTQAVLGNFSGHIAGFKLNTTGGTELVSNAIADASTASRKVLRINLAWVLLALLPVGIVSMIVRRRAMLASFISKKKNVQK